MMMLDEDLTMLDEGFYRNLRTRRVVSDGAHHTLAVFEAEAADLVVDDEEACIQPRIPCTALR